jgi:hypothetical protein
VFVPLSPIPPTEARCEVARTPVFTRAGVVHRSCLAASLWNFSSGALPPNLDVHCQASLRRALHRRVASTGGIVFPFVGAERQSSQRQIDECAVLPLTIALLLPLIYTPLLLIVIEEFWAPVWLIRGHGSLG